MDRSASSNLWSNRALLGVLLFAYAWVKHCLVRLRLAPLRSDPCDAVGAYGILLTMLAAAWCLVLIINWHRKPLFTTRIAELRSHTAIVLAILITLLADGITLVRHLDLWTRKVSPGYLSLLLGGLAVLAGIVQWQILTTQQPIEQFRWKRIMTLILGVAVLLLLCPEWTFRYSSLAAHIITVIVGAIALFLPMRPLLILLVPSPTQDAAWGSPREWAALAAGVLCFVSGFWAVAAPGGPAARLFPRPAGVVAVGGLFVACSVVGGLLGMWRRPT